MKAFDEAEIRKIIEGALFLEERNNSGSVSMKVDDRTKERFSAWQKLLNVTPDKNIFEMRLEGAGITEEKALESCGTPSLQSEYNLPVWAALLKTAVHKLPIEEETAWGAVSLEKENIKLEGPLAALLPFVMTAEKHLCSKYKELPLENLSDILFRRLYYCCAETFNARFRKMFLMMKVTLENSEAGWDRMAKSLLEGEWLDLLSEYPVLARRIGTIMEYYLNFVEEFLDRFYGKKKILEGVFFNGRPIRKISSVEGEISDLHQKGKSVLILTFDGGRRLVYKPRSLEIDVAWEEFLAHFTTEISGIRAPRAIDFKDYGFIEYIEHKPCGKKRDINTYFYNAGALMALMFAFGGNDFHLENIIADQTVPVIVDTETLMIPVARYFGKGGKDDPEKEKKEEESLEAIIERSVMKMGFLPMWQKEGEDKRADYGGLTGDKQDMKNLPVYRGKKYAGNRFSPDILSGFRDMYRHIMKRQEELLYGAKGIRLFENCKFRMLIRNSQVYGNLLRHIAQPALLKDGFDYSMTTDRLANAFLYDAHESIVPQLMNVFRSEKRSVERGDIPIFYGEPGGEGILDEEELLFDRYFERSAIGNAWERIGKFCEEDLAIQLQIIEKSMAAEARNVHEYLSKPGESDEVKKELPLLTKDELLKEAKAIYTEIMDNRIIAKNGDFSWLAEQYDIARSGTSLNIMGPALYDGFLGIAVFAAALYQITKDQDCYDTAVHCVKKAGEYIHALIPNMERYRMPLGYSSGISGYLAGLIVTSEYLEDEEGYELVQEMILGLTEKMIQTDAVFDILGGISGLVLVLTGKLKWHERPETGEHVLNLLKWCGEHLLSQRKPVTREGFQVWESKAASQPLTGLGHGVAGIAAALFRLYEILGDERFVQAGKEAVAYENSVFDIEAGNWPDFRTDPTQKDQPEKQFMGGYCAGAPGIGLARLDGLRRISVSSDSGDLIGTLTEDIRRADRFVRSIRNEGRNHLCCGSAGRIDFLVEEAFQLEDREAAEYAHRILSELIRGKRQRGYYNFHPVNGQYYYNPTLFQGTAGVGYEILRFICPEKIRSILI